MRKRSGLLLPAIIVIIAAVVLYVFDRSEDELPFVSSSTGVHGASLLFDTLQHMGYPVSASRRPLNLQTSIDDAYIIIQPEYFDISDVEEILAWIGIGGRLIFLQNDYPTVLDILIPVQGIRYGNLTVYEFGRGSVVTGRANEITNRNMAGNANTGTAIHSVLSAWDANRIRFGEYYHGAREADNLFVRLPLVVRLVFIQLGIVGIIIVWHLGKRFGNTVPYYEEHERMENEHVHALTRLYMKIGKKPEGRKNNDG